MPLILETIVTTASPDGAVHLVPFGLIREGDDYWVAPFRPSPTIANLEAQPFFAAVAPADIRVIAGCVTGRRDWPTVPCRTIPVPRLAEAYGHMELQVVEVRDDPVRPRFRGRVVHGEAHRPFLGHNRAVNAVLEAAILSTRLHILAPETVLAELHHHRIAVEKTAGPAEREAWNWIAAKVAAALPQAAAASLAIDDA
ncbi:DUF447 domain-containing protein [Methylobacterium platani]|uniref:Tetrahydromethanopterin synthesis protein n=2 Tax=Methylobacterium platani TaxID=427683 RepID=A0A179SDM6_9HYPH|nr:DUF447 domain-containing protein [Methylobacterium platani]KMO15586.1 tetrahydromethanopterin synthesis protein [Methylobacterium platani JCM 14648]OAS25544.1 tetrahydromethanopterin synthesis protein [Methylobacterium platani]